VKSVANAVSTPHPEISVVLMATKLVALTRVSHVNSRNPATRVDNMGGSQANRE
jgi:hypothetical protein